MRGLSQVVRDLQRESSYIRCELNAESNLSIGALRIAVVQLSAHSRQQLIPTVRDGALEIAL